MLLLKGEPGGGAILEVDKEGASSLFFYEYVGWAHIHVGGAALVQGSYVGEGIGDQSEGAVSLGEHLVE